MRKRQGITVAMLITALAAAAAAGQAAAQPTELRLQRLEQQVEALTRRLEALEQGTADPLSTTPSAGTATGPTWTFEPPFDGTGLSAVHYALDTKTGDIELLLRIEAPLADAAAWSRSDGVMPVIAIVDDGADVPAQAVLRLLRGQRLDPGASLHLLGQVPVARAAKAGQIRIRSVHQGLAP